VTRRLALLVNPASGRGRFAGSVDAVVARLASGGYTVTLMVGGDADESSDLARTAVAEGYDSLVVMGGDGMVHLALQPVVGSSTTLGVIATGTGNDVSRTLGIPRRKPLEAADVIVAGVTRRIDVGRTGGIHYATVLAAGFDSLVAERANAMSWPKGKLRYDLATLAELRVFRPLAYQLELDGEPMACEAMLVAVGNCPSYGGGVRICEGARVDDGRLDVVIIKPVSKLGLLKVYPKLFKGTHVTHPAYVRHLVSKVSIAAAGVVAYADGERLAPLPATVEVVPAAVSVFAPAT
jgi:diacylglycerol kinase (ATP)